MSESEDSSLAVATYGNETVLSAAVRAGVRVAYGCNNGNCGECLARVVDGETRRVRAHDFALSERQQLRGYFLMCSTTAQTDLTVEANTSSETREHALRATIRKIHRADGCADMIVLSARPQRSRRLRFIAGQYARLSFADYEPIECSIASCPCDETQMEFHIFATPDNDLREWLFNHARPGQKIDLFGPLGRWTFSGDYARPAIFIAHTLGFAPVKSVLEHVMAQESRLPVMLYRIADEKHPHYLLNLCRAWDDAFDQLTVKYGDASAATFDDLVSAVNEWRASGHNGDTMKWNNFDVYVSTPDDLLAPWRDALLAAGVARERIFCETARG